MTDKLSCLKRVMVEHIARAKQSTRHPGLDISESMGLSYSAHKPVVEAFSTSV